MESETFVEFYGYFATSLNINTVGQWYLHIKYGAKYVVHYLGFQIMTAILLSSIFYFLSQL